MILSDNQKIQLWQLKQRQSLPLEAKIIHSKNVIRQWYEAHDGQVYVSFSGGKDSTVLLHLVRSIYGEDVKAVFVDTGLEYPEIKDFVKQTPNVDVVKPEMSFREVLKTQGYPVGSKMVSRMVRTIRNETPNNQATRTLYLTGIKQDGTKSKYFKLAKKWHPLINAPFDVSEKCCDYMKKKPFDKYVKKTGLKPYSGVMASDSQLRRGSYLQSGCNSFKTMMSIPLAIWTEADVWEYLLKYNVPYCKIYDMGEKRTGCIFCLFGIQMEKSPNRFERMKKTHPKLYDYCMNNLGLKEVLDYINVKY